MKKIRIVEIENSYLNFFTPAIIVAIAYFLFNLMGWPILIIEHTIEGFNELEPNFKDIIYFSLEILFQLILAIIAYFVFIPKLKIKHIDNEKSTIHPFFVVLIAISIFIMIYKILHFVVDFFSIEIFSYTQSYDFLDSKVVAIFYVLNILTPTLFMEIVYRRTIIPLLEDRGLSPIHSIFLASFGSVIISLPLFILIIYYGTITEWTLIGILFDNTIYFIFGLFAGFIYILTRNIFYPIVFAMGYHLYNEIYLIGISSNNQSLIDITNIILILCFMVILIIISYQVIKYQSTSQIPNWFTIFKKHSVPHIYKGIIGFLIFPTLLLIIQAIYVIIARRISGAIDDPKNIFKYFILVMPFYFAVFTVPFWLTVSTEYARD